MRERADGVEGEIAPCLEPDLGANVGEDGRLEPRIDKHLGDGLGPERLRPVQLADRETVALRSPDSVRGFLAEGGRAIVVKARKLDAVESATPVDVVSRSRSGRRELLVVVPTREAATTARDAESGGEDGASDGAVRRRSAP